MHKKTRKNQFDHITDKAGNNQQIKRNKNKMYTLLLLLCRISDSCLYLTIQLEPWNVLMIVTIETKVE